MDLFKALNNLEESIRRGMKQSVKLNVPPPIQKKEESDEGSDDDYDWVDMDELNDAQREMVEDVSEDSSDVTSAESEEEEKEEEESGALIQGLGIMAAGAAGGVFKTEAIPEGQKKRHARPFGIPFDRKGVLWYKRPSKAAKGFSDVRVPKGMKEGDSWSRKTKDGKTVKFRFKDGKIQVGIHKKYKDIKAGMSPIDVGRRRAEGKPGERPPKEEGVSGPVGGAPKDLKVGQQFKDKQGNLWRKTKSGKLQLVRAAKDVKKPEERKKGEKREKPEKKEKKAKKVAKLEDRLRKIAEQLGTNDPRYKKMYAKLKRASVDNGHGMLGNKDLKKLLEQYDLLEEINGLQELAGFKKTLGARGRGRNPDQLKREFVKRMDPRNYIDAKGQPDPKAFDQAKKRILNMTVADFAVLLAVINSDEDDLDAVIAEEQRRFGHLTHKALEEHEAKVDSLLKSLLPS